MPNSSAALSVIFSFCPPLPSCPQKHSLSCKRSIYCVPVPFHAFLTPRGASWIDRRGCEDLSLSVYFGLPGETHSTSTGRPSRPLLRDCFGLLSEMGILFPFVGKCVLVFFFFASKPLYICGIEIGNVSSHDQTVFE